MSTDTPPSDPAPRPDGVDWSQFVRDVHLTESAREVGDAPVAIPDRMHLDGFPVDIQPGTWTIAGTGTGLATIHAHVRRRDVRVARPGGATRPRVYISGVRVLTPDTAIPDTTGSPQQWIPVWFYGLRIRIAPAHDPPPGSVAPPDKT